MSSLVSGAARRATWLAAALFLVALPSVGCDDLVRSLIDVPEADGPPRFPDGSIGDSDAEFSDRLSIAHVRPSHGPFIGGNTAVITGSGFQDGVEVWIAGRAIQVGQTRLLSPATVEVVVPAGEVGPAEVELVAPGDQRVTLPAGYTYDPVYFDPSSGPTNGGTLVTLHGKDTDFTAGMKLELGGSPLTEVEVVSATTLRGKVPPGAEGPADLVLGTGQGDATVEDAFTYYASADPLSGGLGGGTVSGTVTVTVLNWLTRQPVEGATVYLQRGRDLQLTGTADPKGSVVFSHPQLVGPLSVTAGAPEHETASIVEFDARDVTLFLFPIIQPQPGPLPPGQRMGLVEGFVLFGGITGAGSTRWRIVPEPKEGQVKRVYVYVTNPSIRHGPPFADASATIDFASGDASAWPYSVYTRLGTMAIYAVAGLYNRNTAKFEPYAMGITRGLVLGPGDRLERNILIDIPLTEKVTVKLQQPPQGVNRHRMRLAIDLGADGVILRRDTERQADGVPEVFAFGRLPSFNRQGLFDASYTADVLLDNASSPAELPIARATEAAVQPVDGVILIDQFIGVPRQVKPLPRGVLQGNTLAWSFDGGQPSLAVTLIQLADETPVWRVISPGEVTEVKLPDPESVGLPAWPETALVWQQWLVRLPAYDYETFNYSHLNSRYWDRWSFDEFTFEVLAP
jgi:hypothetical protein